ncbi:MAG TPA: HEAT repeat domain-containing protein [Planctomycetota bacterium]|nr:HEAT repeat domain-containing protein [Planctomycetota bacterium]
MTGAARHPALCAVLFAAAVAGASTAQESAPAAESRAVDWRRLLDRANSDNPYFSAGATKVLEARGLEAWPALDSFVRRRSIYALSAPVTTWLGKLDHPPARALLRRAARDPEFPWRPYAVRALAEAPREDDRALFRDLLEDPLPAAREAAAEGLGRCPATASDDETAALRARLADSSFDVRAAAADALFKRGDRSALPVMVDALDLVRRFFDLDFGEIARRRAWALVAPIAGEGVPYDPGAPPEHRAFAMTILRRRLALDASPDGAASRPAAWAPDVDRVVFGLEVRSCRRGDAFLRLTAEGDLVTGQYDLKAGRIPPALLATLREEIERARAVPERPLYGRPGCDFERYYLPDEDGLRRLTVGPEGRPAGLTRLAALLTEALRETQGDVAAEAHLRRTAPFAGVDDYGAEGESDDPDGG